MVQDVKCPAHAGGVVFYPYPYYRNNELTPPTLTGLCMMMGSRHTWGHQHLVRKVHLRCPAFGDRRDRLSVASECFKGVSCEFCFTTLTTGSPATSCPTSGCSCCKHSHLPDMKSCWSMAMPNLWTKPKLRNSSATRTSGLLVSVP